MCLCVWGDCVLPRVRRSTLVPRTATARSTSTSQEVMVRSSVHLFFFSSHFYFTVFDGNNCISITIVTQMHMCWMNTIDKTGIYFKSNLFIYLAFLVCIKAFLFLLRNPYREMCFFQCHHQNVWGKRMVSRWDRHHQDVRELLTSLGYHCSVLMY